MKKIFFTLILALTSSTGIVFAQGTSEMNNSQNPYKYRGLEYYLFMNHLVDSIFTHHENGGTFDGVHIWYNYHSDIYLNLDEENIIVSFFDSTEFNLTNLISFENYLLNTELEFHKEKILEHVSFMIWTKYFFDELKTRASNGSSGGIGEFEICLDYCMKRKMDQMNSPDMVFFIWGLPATALQYLASCTYECLGGKQLHLQYKTTYS